MFMEREAKMMCDKERCHGKSLGALKINIIGFWYYSYDKDFVNLNIDFDRYIERYNGEELGCKS